MIFTFVVLILSFLRCLYTAGESNDSTSLKRDRSESPLYWGAKRARTARYEIIDVNDESSRQINSNSKSESKCDICRPACAHWKNLTPSKRTTESVRWHVKNLTKEGKEVYKKQQREIKRKWYSRLTEEQKEERRQRAVLTRRIRLNKMTPSNNNSQGRQSASERESSIDPDRIALQNSENTMNLPIGWPQKKQRSRRFEIYESKPTSSSSSSESDGDSWDMITELTKSKSSKGRAKRLQIIKPKSQFNEVKKGNECIIHRPGCDHWDDLDRKDKNKHAKRWQYFNSSKAQRDKKLSRRRQLYNAQTGEDVIKRREKSKLDRNTRRLKMTDEEYRAYRDDRNKYRRELRIRKNTGAPVRKMKARQKDSQ